MRAGGRVDSEGAGGGRVAEVVVGDGAYVGQEVHRREEAPAVEVGQRADRGAAKLPAAVGDYQVEAALRVGASELGLEGLIR